MRMTAFLWTVVIVMAAALLAEILAFVGMALTTIRAAHRASEIAGQLKDKVESSVHLAKELQRSLVPRAETISHESKEIATLVATRSQSIQAVLVDTSRRAERIRLRLAGGVQTV